MKTYQIGSSDVAHEVDMVCLPGEKPYISLVIHPIPDPPNPRHNALTGECDNADIFGVEFDALIEDFLAPHNFGPGKGRADVEEMKAWAEALETGASKIRSAIAALQLQLAAKL